MNFHTYKISQSLRVIIFTLSLFVFTGCADAYREHFFLENQVVPSVSWEFYIPGATDTLLVLPDKKIKDELLHSIDSAQERIWIAIYMWTDKDILTHVIDAHERWVDVRVILEWNVYGLPRANATIFSALQSAWVPVVYADSYRFTFTHAKFWVIDSRYYMSTGNLTRSFFETNRDLIFSGIDSNILSFLGMLFVADFSYKWVDNSLIPWYMVIAPIDARKKLESLLQGAERDISIYTQTLEDQRILSLLQQKQDAWISIKICTALNESNTSTSSGSIFPWVLVKKPYLHQKIIIVDGEYVFLWSQNLTQNSLDNNREVGLIFQDTTRFLPVLDALIQKDCDFD